MANLFLNQSFPDDIPTDFGDSLLFEENNTVIKLRLSDIPPEKLELEDQQNDDDLASENSGSSISDDYSDSPDNFKETNTSVFDSAIKMEENIFIEKEEEKDIKDIHIETKLEFKDNLQEDKLNLKDSEVEKTRKYIKYNSRFAKIANIKEDFSIKPLTEEEKIRLALESGVRFNDRVILNKMKVKEHMKYVERQKVSQRTPLENANAIFPSNYIPLYLYDENCSEFFDLNGSTQIEKTTVEKFISHNISHEHSNSMPEHYNRLGFYPGRRFQRRRRRRTSKMMMNGAHE